MTKYIKTSDNISSKIQNETVMVNASKGDYYSLNEVGSFIYDLLSKPLSQDEICIALLNEYEIDEETCKKEVQEFIAQLLKMEIIKVYE